MPTFADLDSPPAAVSPAQDFWRSGATNVAGALPDGVNDTTEIVHREGRTAIQNTLGAIPAFVNGPMLDIANGARSGVDGRTTLNPFYATGLIPGMPAFNAAGLPTPIDGAEIRHSNQTQGFGFAFNGIYATGSGATQDFYVLNRGGGIHGKLWQALNGGFFFDDHYGGVALAGNQGWQERYFAGGTSEFITLMRRSTRVFPGAGTLGNETFYQGRAENGALVNNLYIGPSMTQTNTYPRMEIGNNTVNDDKIVLFGVNSTTFFGFGIKSSTLASFVSSSAAFFRYYDSQNPTLNLFSISGVGNVTVDPQGIAAAGWTSPVIRFGSEVSGDGIRSQRTVVDRFQNDIEVYTATARRFAVLANGRIYMAVVPVFASDGAAAAGGLQTGEIWRDALGILHWKL